VLVLEDAEPALFDAEPAFLDAGERRRDREQLVGVDPDGAGLERARDPPRAGTLDREHAHWTTLSLRAKDSRVT
jgi:hypothetical protein